MPDIEYMPPFRTPEKPRYGSPCNGCGWCCHSEVCALGKMAFKDAVAPCPAMIFEEGKVRCGLVLAEMELGGETLLQDALGIGKGCCSDDPQHTKRGDDDQSN